MNSERMSFDDACRDLGITEEELEQLVAAGEIATIKEGDTLYFKKDVVKKFKMKKDDSAVLLTDDEINLLDDSSVEEIDLLADDDATDESTTPARPVAAAPKAPAHKAPASPPRAAVPAAAADDDLEISLDSDDDIPSLDLDSDDELAGIELTPAGQKAGAGGDDEGDETLLNMDGLLEEDSEGTTPIPADAEDATLLDTDVLDLAGEADPFNADTAEETSSADLTEAGTLLRSGGARVMQMKRKSGNPWMTGVLALSTVLMLLPLGTLTHVIFTSSPESKTGTAPKGSFGWITDLNIADGAVEWVADLVKPAK